MKRALASLALVTAAVCASAAPGGTVTKTQLAAQITVQQLRADVQELTKRIVVAVEAFESAGKADNLPVMVAACKQLVSTSVDAERLPVPYRSVQVRWHAAMIYFLRGGEGFLSGLNGGHVILIHEATAAFRTGMADVQIATEAVNHLTSRAV
jgi:hypothetical protein